jgi:hypothetical protein
MSSVKKKPAAKGKRPTRAALRRELRHLARDFADELVNVLDRHGMWDDSSPEEPTRDDAARRIRRSLGDLEKVMHRILADLKTRKEPVSIGKVAATLGLSSRQVAHPMGLLVDDGRVLRGGVRRGARYELAPPPKPQKKKAAKRSKRRKKA